MMAQQQPPPPRPAATAGGAGDDNNALLLSLFDLCLDLPHPAASSKQPPELIPSPVPPREDLTRTLPQISQFAFPEYEPQQQQSQNPHAFLNKYDRYAMQSPGFQLFTFTLQLQSGVRLYGHVRRYLPLLLSRYEVGRRSERALVVLTRARGADELYAGILKSMQALLSQEKVNETTKYESVRYFVHALFQYHQHLATRVYQTTQPVEKRAGKPLMAALDGLELGRRNVKKGVDVHRFLLPPSLLLTTTTTTTTSILPLLRCIGITHTLRLMAALLSERRVILVSHSPTRLATCSHAALSMLAQGLLDWQHVFIPVLPLALWQYLAAPYPYLIGILAAIAPRLDHQTDGLALGEVLILHLDTNRMETRGYADPSVIAQRLPDLFRNNNNNMMMLGAAASSNNPTANLAAAATAATTGDFLGSAPDVLASDLQEALRQDSRLLYGDPQLSMQTVTKHAEKATKAVKNTFSKLVKGGQKMMSNSSMKSAMSSWGSTRGGGSENFVSASERSFAESERSTFGGDDDDEIDQGSSLALSSSYEGAGEAKSLSADYIYTEASHNETTEEQVRTAFTWFFLALFGNVKWYLSQQQQPNVPTFDRDRFLQTKRQLGDGPGTPLWPLLLNLVQTQMLQEFCKNRVEEIAHRTLVTAESPLFLQCAAYHRQHSIDFGIASVRQIAQQYASASSSRTNNMQAAARRTAMTLTSNKPYEGDTTQAIAQLVEQCRESTLVLSCVMAVIWMRLRDCRGGLWKHGYWALQILRHLLYHGPLAAIAEATDGLDIIRALKLQYENTMRKDAVQQIKSLAATVYQLLTDLSLLYAVRRTCAMRRYEMQHADSKKPRPQKDTRLAVTIPFKSIHAALNPSAARGTFARIPPARQLHMDRGAPTAQQQGLNRVSSLGKATTAQPVVDFFSSAGSQISQGAGSAAADMFGLFGNMSVGGSSGRQQQQAAADPFASRSHSNSPIPPRQQGSSPVPPPGGGAAPQPPPNPFDPMVAAGRGYAAATAAPAPQPAPPPPPPQGAPRQQQQQQQYYYQQQQQQQQAFAQPQQYAPTYAITPGQQQQQQQQPPPQPPHAQQQQYAPTYAVTPPGQQQQARPATSRSQFDPFA